MTDNNACLRAAYDNMAASYGNVRNTRFDEFRDKLLKWFADSCKPISGRIADLGSGPGLESSLLKNFGLNPLALDFSPNMVQRARNIGVDALEMDFNDLQLPAKSFGGVLMSFSLLHTPKAKAQDIVRSAAELLMPAGIMLVMLFEGEGEGPRDADISRYGVARWFAYYKESELVELLAGELEVIRTWRLEISPRPTIAVAGRRRGG